MEQNKIIQLRDFVNSLLGYYNDPIKARGEQIKSLLEYAGFNSNLNLNRFILVGDSLVCLPKNFTSKEKKLGEWIANVSSVSIKEYKKILPKQYVNLPVPVIMVKSNKHMESFVRNIGFAGPVSITFTPFFSTFNLEAYNYTLNTLGSSIGKSAARYSFVHENSHPLQERARLNLAVGKNYSIEEFVLSRQHFLTVASTIYENSGDEIQSFDLYKGSHVKAYPYEVAKLEPRNKLLSIKDLFDYEYYGNSEKIKQIESILYPLQKGKPYEVPFVTYPQSAHAKILSIKVTNKLKQLNPNFKSWTSYFFDYLEQDALLKGITKGSRMPFPKHFSEAVEFVQKTTM